MNHSTTLHRFDLLNDGNHAVIPVNGLRVFLDTGSPFTFRHPRGPSRFSLFEQEVSLPNMPVPAGNMEAGSDLLGFHFDVLMGVDLMSQLAWRLDWATGTAEAAPTLDDEGGTTWVRMPPSMGMTNACPSCRVNGERDLALFDTGAQLSYRVGSPSPTARLVGEIRDFNPQLGIFETQVWEDSLEIGGHQIPIRFGRVPSQAQGLFEAMGVQWILGSDLIRSFRVTLDFPQHRLGLKLHEIDPMKSPKG
jgi:hypothetical protein